MNRIKEIKEKRIKYGIERMARLGFIDTTDKQDRHEIVKQFTKYDDDELATDVINYFYNIDGLEVFTNNLKYGCGSRLDRDLLYEVELMFYELERYFGVKE